VLADVKRELVSPQAANAIYGVVIGNNGIDIAATAHRRAEMHADRRNGASQARHATGQANARKIGRVGEYLEIVEDGDDRAIVCRCCGHRFCDDTGNPKAAATCREAPLTDAGPLFPPDEDTPCILRLYWCPGCGVQFGAEIAEKGSAPLVDIALKRPQ
jgi:DNA-directed RNA polymerase subunit RPC12/RpoP